MFAARKEPESFFQLVALENIRLQRFDDSVFEIIVEEIVTLKNWIIMLELFGNPRLSYYMQQRN